MDRVQFHPEARAEYQDALAWYFDRSAQAAARFEADLDPVLDLLAANPRLFPSYDELHRFCMLDRFPYSVVYRTHPDSIEIIAVAHSRRSTGYWEGRE